MLEGQKQKVHSLVDKVYSRKNLKLAWEFKLVNLVSLIPSLRITRNHS
jgi:hypothetical protein